MKKRKQRRHGVLPAGFKWRNGRPRWEPAPGLRSAGWKGRDLKDVRGEWLAQGAAVTAGVDIVAAVEAWRRGETIPVDFEDIAPPGAVLVGGAAMPIAAFDPRSIGHLMDLYMGVKAPDGTWSIEPSNEWNNLAPKTQTVRRSGLSRFIDILGSYAAKPGKAATDEERTLYDVARATVRSLSIDTLEPPLGGQGGDDFLYEAYWSMRERVGLHAAHGMMADVSAWLSWCVKPRRVIRSNWAKEVDRETPPGRIVTWYWEDMRVFIATAEEMGWHSQADALILGADLSWNQVDRLAIAWDQAKDGRIHASRQKTGRKGATKLLDQLGKPRIQEIRRRQEKILGPGCCYTHVLICESTGRPWKTDYFRQVFADIRARAALTHPRLAELRDQDLRDTAVTIAYEAGLTLPEIASRTLHSLKRIHEILDAHYGDINHQVGDHAAEKLNAYLAGRLPLWK